MREGAGVTLTPGNAAPRYAQARSFGVINEDVGLPEGVQIHEKGPVQIGGEFLNVFNRSTLGNPNTNVLNSLFGRITGISLNRGVQSGARLDLRGNYPDRALRKQERQ
jgi:hypothetical protein